MRRLQQIRRAARARASAAAAVAAVLLAAACGDGGGVPQDAAAGATTRDTAGRSSAVDSVAAAFEALVRGPTEEERARGIDSWFSVATAESIQAVRLEDGFLVVDFRGLPSIIPNAGSSAGSEQLLTALDSTAFQFPQVDSVEYRLEGSCAAFWEWLQRGCQIVRRGGGGAGGDRGGTP